MKRNLSYDKLIKYLNKELSEAEYKEVEKLIESSEKYSTLIDELKATYDLVDKAPRLKENTNLYTNIINKVTNVPVQEPLTETLIKPLFHPLRHIMVAASIFIAIITGVSIGNKITQPSQNIDMATIINSEFYMNELQLETIENHLWEN